MDADSKLDYVNEHNLPRVIIILSGKRKSGKDYISECLRQRLGSDETAILRLSEPLKKQYAKENCLNGERLLDSTQYKEIYRKEMILWGEEKRNCDPGYFCRLTIEQSLDSPKEKHVWIISDARRETDIHFFEENYSGRVKKVRIVANDEVRKSRGWCFTNGVDDVESECGLDKFGKWDYIIGNNGNDDELEKFIFEIESVLQPKDIKK